MVAYVGDLVELVRKILRHEVNDAIAVDAVGFATVRGQVKVGRVVPAFTLQVVVAAKRGKRFLNDSTSPSHPNHPNICEHVWAVF